MQDRSKLAESALEQLADAVICADRSGAIIQWNRASAALFGYSSHEALGRSLDLIIPEHLRARHWSGFDTAVTTGGTKLQGRPTLTRAAHKSGRKLYVEMSLAIVIDDADGEVLGAVATASDEAQGGKTGVRKLRNRDSFCQEGVPSIRSSGFDDFISRSSGGPGPHFWRHTWGSYR